MLQYSEETYSSWFQTTVNYYIDHNVDNKINSVFLNLGSGKRPRIEDLKADIGGKEELIGRVFNADWVTFKTEPGESNQLSSISKNLDKGIIEFMEGIRDESFSNIISMRYFEHIPWEQLGYYLYQMYRVVRNNGTMLFIVPNFTLVTKAAKEIETKWDYEKWQTINSEVFNCKQDSHSCWWTPKIAKPLLENEGYWKVTNVIPQVCVDGRNWYMAVEAVKSPKFRFKV